MKKILSFFLTFLVMGMSNVEAGKEVLFENVSAVETVETVTNPIIVETTAETIMTTVNQESTTTVTSTTAVTTTTTTATKPSTTVVTTTVPPTTTVKSTTTKPQSIDTTSKASYTDEELYMMSHLIYAEAGNQSDKAQRYAGSVVLNRIKHPNYPNTMKGVIFQRGQYSCTWDGNYQKTPSQKAINNAIYVLEHGSILPKNVVYQAQFKQGSGVYEQIGNTYYCYY